MYSERPPMKNCGSPTSAYKTAILSKWNGNFSQRISCKMCYSCKYMLIFSSIWCSFCSLRPFLLLFVIYNMIQIALLLQMHRNLQHTLSILLFFFFILLSAWTKFLKIFKEKKNHTMPCRQCVFTSSGCVCINFPLLFYISLLFCFFFCV